MRIIAGSRKGARIFAPKGLETRPTGDRVREAVFNLVGPVDGAEVLDELVGRGPVVVRRRDHHRASAGLRRVDAELHGLDRGERRGPGHDRETPVGRGEEGLGDQLALVEIQSGELPGAPPDDETVDPGRHQVLGQAVDRGRVALGYVCG